MKKSIKENKSFREWEFEPETKEAKKILKQMEEFLLKSVGKRCRSKAVGCLGCELWMIYDLFKLNLL